jgi:hypothetical protein
LHGHLFYQVAHVFGGLAPILGYHFVAGAVKTQRVTEWNMDVQRERAGDAANFAFRHPQAIAASIESFSEAIRGGVRGIARTVFIQPAYQLQVNYKLVDRFIHKPSLITGHYASWTPETHLLAWQNMHPNGNKLIFLRHCRQLEGLHRHSTHSPLVSGNLLAVSSWLINFPNRTNLMRASLP